MPSRRRRLALCVVVALLAPGASSGKPPAHRRGAKRPKAEVTRSTPADQPPGLDLTVDEQLARASEDARRRMANMDMDVSCVPPRPSSRTREQMERAARMLQREMEAMLAAEAERQAAEVR